MESVMCFVSRTVPPNILGPLDTDLVSFPNLVVCLDCEAIALPVASIVWQRNALSLPSDASKYRQHPNGEFCSLPRETTGHDKLQHNFLRVYMCTHL